MAPQTPPDTQIRFSRKGFQKNVPNTTQQVLSVLLERVLERVLEMVPKQPNKCLKGPGKVLARVPEKVSRKEFPEHMINTPALACSIPALACSIPA